MKIGKYEIEYSGFDRDIFEFILFISAVGLFSWYVPLVFVFLMLGILAASFFDFDVDYQKNYPLTEKQIKKEIENCDMADVVFTMNALLESNKITRAQYKKFMPSLAERVEDINLYLNYLDDKRKDAEEQKEELQKEQLIIELAGIGAGA